jgi:hypothetical protein
MVIDSIWHMYGKRHTAYGAYSAYGIGIGMRCIWRTAYGLRLTALPSCYAMLIDDPEVQLADL